MRLVAAVLACALVVLLGALILGEYEVDGLTSLLAAAFLGFSLGEVVTAVARRRDWAAAALAGAAAAVTLAWGAWISAGRTYEGWTTGARIAPLAAVVIAALTVRTGRVRSSAPPADDTPPGS